MYAFINCAGVKRECQHVAAVVQQDIDPFGRVTELCFRTQQCLFSIYLKQTRNHCQAASGTWYMDKLGTPIKPTEVGDGGCQAQHAVWSGVELVGHVFIDQSG